MSQLSARMKTREVPLTGSGLASPRFSRRQFARPLAGLALATLAAGPGCSNPASRSGPPAILKYALRKNIAVDSSDITRPIHTIPVALIGLAGVAISPDRRPTRSTRLA